jgi:hypothetical protein
LFPANKNNAALPPDRRVVDLEMVDLEDVKKHIVMGIASHRDGDSSNGRTNSAQLAIGPTARI